MAMYELSHRMLLCEQFCLTGYLHIPETLIIVNIGAQAVIHHMKIKPNPYTHNLYSV